MRGSDDSNEYPGTKYQATLPSLKSLYQKDLTLEEQKFINQNNYNSKTEKNTPPTIFTLANNQKFFQKPDSELNSSLIIKEYTDKEQNRSDMININTIASIYDKEQILNDNNIIVQNLAENASKSSFASKNLIDVVTKMNNHQNDEMKQEEALFQNDIMITDEYIMNQINQKPYLRKSFYNLVENYSDSIESPKNQLPQFDQIKEGLQQKIKEYRQQNDTFYEQQDRLIHKYVQDDFQNLVKNNFENANAIISQIQNNLNEYLKEEEDFNQQMHLKKTLKSKEIDQIQLQYEQNREILMQLQLKLEKMKEIEKNEKKKELQNQRYMKSQQKIIYQKILESARNLQDQNEDIESGKLHILSPISQSINKTSQSQTRQPQTTKMEQQQQNLKQEKKKFQNIKDNLNSSFIETDGKQNQRSRNQQLQENFNSKSKGQQSYEGKIFLSGKVSDLLKDKEILNTLQNFKMLDQEDEIEQSYSNELCNVDLDEADELNSDFGKQSQKVDQLNSNDVNNTGKFNDLMDQIFQKCDHQIEEKKDSKTILNNNEYFQYENKKNKPGNQIKILSNQYLQINNVKMNPYQEGIFSQNNINSQSISTKEGSKRSIANKNINQVSNFLKKSGSTKSIENQINQYLHEQLVHSMNIEHLEKEIKEIDDLINLSEQRTKQFIDNQNKKIQELKEQHTEFYNQFSRIKNSFKDEIDQLSSQNRDHDEPLSWQSVQKQLKMLDGVEKLYKLKTEAWENEIRSLQDKCQKRQFQIDHLKNEVANQVLSMANNNQLLKNSLKIKDYSQPNNLESDNVMENILKNDAIQNLDKLQKQVAQLYKQVFTNEQNRQLLSKNHEERRNTYSSVGDVNSTIYKHKHSNNLLYDEINQIIDFNLTDFFNQNQVPSTLEQFQNARGALNINSLNIQKIVGVLSSLASENDMLYDLVDQLAGISLSNYYEFSEYLKQEIGVEEEEIESQFIKQTRNRIKSKIKTCLLELTQIQKDIIFAHQNNFLENNLQNNKLKTQDIKKQKNSSQTVTMPYINRYSEMINEARDLFVQDLSRLQEELHKSRKILIQLYSKCEKYQNELKNQLKENTKISTELTSTTANLKDLQSQFEKLQLELNSLKSDSQLLHSQNQNLELLNQNKEKQVQQLCDDLFKVKNQNSQLEQSIFENQQEIIRTKNQFNQNKQQHQQLEEQNNELKIQIQNLQIENQDLYDEQSGDVFEAILRDVSNWMNEIQQYNSNFLENMDLVNQLNFMISDDQGDYFYGDEDDSKFGLNALNQEQVVKIIKKLAGHAENFEPLRQRMKLNIYMIEKKIHEYRIYQQNKRIQMGRKNYDDIQTLNDWKSSGRKNNLTVRSSYKQRQIDSPSPQKLNNFPGSALLKNQNKRSLKRKLNDQSRNHSKKKSSDGEVEILEKNERVRNSEKNQTFTKFIHTEKFLQDGLYDNKLTSVNQDLRLRLDMCHDDIFELEKKLKMQSIQLIKLEDYKIKFMHNQENFNKLKSRFKIVKSNLEDIIKNNGQNSIVDEIQRLLDMIETFPNIALHNLTQFASLENASMISQYRANQKAPKINRYSNKSQVALQRQNIAKSEYNKINKEQINDDNNIQQLLNMSGSDNKESSRGIHSEMLTLKNQKTEDLTKREQINIVIRQPSSNQHKQTQDDQNESQNFSISLNNISKDLSQFNKNRNNVSSFGLRQATFGIDVLDPLMQQAKMLSNEVVNSIKNELLNKQIQKVMIDSSTLTDSLKKSDVACQTDSSIKTVSGSNIGRGISKVENFNQIKSQNQIQNEQIDIFDQMPAVKISKLDSQEAFQSNWQSLSKKNKQNDFNFQTFQQPTKIYQSPTKISNFKSQSKPELNKQNIQKQNFLIQPSEFAQINDQNSLQKQFESEQINIIVNQTYNQETKNSPLSQKSEFKSIKESVKTSKNSSINSKASKYLTKNKQNSKNENESHKQSKMSLRQAEKSNIIDQNKLDELDFKFDIIQEDLNKQNLVRNESKLYYRRDSNLANFDNQLLKKQMDLQNIGFEDLSWINEQQSDIKSSPNNNSKLRKRQDMLIIEESAEQDKQREQSNKKQEVIQYQDFIDQNNISRKSSILAIQGQNISISHKQNVYESQKSKGQENIVQENINQINQIDKLTNEGNDFDDNEQGSIPELNEHFFQINDEEEQSNPNAYKNEEYNDNEFMDIDNENYFQSYNREDQVNKNYYQNKIRDPYVETIQEELEGEDQSYNDNNHKSSINTFKGSKKTANPLNSFNNNEDINSHNFSIASDQSNKASKHKPKYSVGNVLPNFEQQQRAIAFIDKQQNNFVYDSQSSNSAEIVKNVQLRLNKIVNNQALKQQNFSIKNTSSIQESDPLENVESLNNSNHENYSEMKKMNIQNTLKHSDIKENKEQFQQINESFRKSSNEKQIYNDQYEKQSKINDESSFKSFIN